MQMSLMKMSWLLTMQMPWLLTMQMPWLLTMQMSWLLTMQMSWLQTLSLSVGPVIFLFFVSPAKKCVSQRGSADYCCVGHILASSDSKSSKSG